MARLCLILLLVLLVAAALPRVQLAQDNPFPSVDGVHYMEQSRRLLERGSLPFSSFPPGWPLLICVPLAMMDLDVPIAPLRAAQAANTVFGVALGLLCFFALRDRVGRWPALVASAILLFLPQMFALAKSDLSDLSFTCAIVGAWILLERNRRLLAGLVLGYAYVIRPEGILIAVGFAIFHLVRERRVPWRLAIGTAICVVPCLVFIRVASGAWSLSSKGGFLSASLAENPGLSFFGLIGHNLVEFLPHLPGLIGLPLVLMAIWGAIRRPGRWLLCLLPLLMIPLFSFLLTARYWVPYLPFILLGAGLGLRDVLAGVPAHARRWTAVAATVVLFGGLTMAAIDDVPSIRLRNESYNGMQDAGLWLRPQVERETIVAAYKPYVAFWAGCRHLPFKRESTLPAIIESARLNGAEYLVINVQVALTIMPVLRPLMETPTPELARLVTPIKVLEYEGRPIQNTAIYALNNPLRGPLADTGTAPAAR